MSRIDVNREYFHGEDWAIPFEVVDWNDVVVPLTDPAATLSWILEDEAGTNLITQTKANGRIVITNAALGTGIINVSEAEQDVAAITPTTYYHELKVFVPGYGSSVQAAGLFIVRRSAHKT